LIYCCERLVVKGRQALVVINRGFSNPTTAFCDAMLKSLVDVSSGDMVIDREVSARRVLYDPACQHSVRQFGRGRADR
jgi:hypothetical protein